MQLAGKLTAAGSRNRNASLHRTVLPVTQLPNNIPIADRPRERPASLGHAPISPYRVEVGLEPVGWLKSIREAFRHGQKSTKQSLQCDFGGDTMPGWSPAVRLDVTIQ